MTRSKLSFFLIIFLLIAAITFVAGLKAEEVSPEEKRTIEREFITAAQKLAERGKIEEAIEIYERIVKRVPDDLEYRAQLATLYSAIKQYESAAQTWEKLLEDDSENIKYQDALVNSLQAAGKVDEAFEIARVYIQTQPEVGIHYERLARIHETQGNLDAAITNYEKAIELTPGDVRIQTYLKLAAHYVLKENIAAAEKILKNAMLYTPSEFERQDIKLQLIKLYLYQANLVEVLQKAEAEGMPISYVMSNSEERAQHYRNTGELEKSVAYFKISLVMTDSYHERERITNELLNMYIEQDRMDLALELYEYEVKCQKKNSDQRLTRVSTLFGPFGIELKFGGDDARKTLIDGYKNQGKLDLLRNFSEGKLEKDVDNPAFIEMLAEVYWNANEYQKAAEAYQALSKVEPNNIRSFYLAAIAFQKSNQPDMKKELLEQVETALASVNYKRDGSFLSALATICLKNEMYDQAIQLAGDAIIEAQNFVEPAIELIGKAIIEAQNFAEPAIERVGKTIIEAQNSNRTLIVNTCLRIIWESHIGLVKYYSKNNMPDKAMEQMRQTGIIHEKAWVILGPFDNTAGIGYNIEYILENTTEIDLTTKYEGIDELISWENFTDGVFDGFIDLGSNNNWCVSYSMATITSPDDRKVFLRFSSDDQSKMWLNGTEVFSDATAQSAILDRYTIPVTLKAGKNTILVKVCNEERDWGFYLRVTDTDGKPFEDLKFNDVQNN